ncbi:MAG: preprotein translocase subunit YajC, partial [Clostridia bacterium]|nr:preprotein translocase subunit YajC [Clostridia bacterium]
MNQLLVSALSFLADEGGEQSWFQKYGLWIVLGVIVVLLFAWFFFSGKKNKQKQKEYVEQLDAIAPGNKVKTAGGICGIVVEVCDDNTVIIKTGSEESGYSFVKMEKELIAQTDAKGPTQIAREEAEARKRLEKEAAEAEKKAAEKHEDETVVAAAVEEAKAEA